MRLGYSSRGEGTEMPERTGVRADDPYSGRQPTSHERRAGEPWDAAYVDGHLGTLVKDEDLSRYIL